MCSLIAIFNFLYIITRQLDTLQPTSMSFLKLSWKKSTHCFHKESFTVLKLLHRMHCTAHVDLSFLEKDGNQMGQKLGYMVDVKGGEIQFPKFCSGGT